MIYLIYLKKYIQYSAIYTTIQPAFIKEKTIFPFSYYVLVSWFFGLVGKTASWKIKNASYFLNHDALIRTLKEVIKLVSEAVTEIRSVKKAFLRPKPLYHIKLWYDMHWIARPHAITCPNQKKEAWMCDKNFALR